MLGETKTQQEEQNSKLSSNEAILGSVAICCHLRKKVDEEWWDHCPSYTGAALTELTRLMLIG